jgi:hypothetical protein
MAIPLMAIISGLGLLGSAAKKLDKMTEVDPAGVNKKDESEGSITDDAQNILALYEKVKGGQVTLSDEEQKFIKKFDPREIASVVIKSGQPLDSVDLRSVLSMIPQDCLTGLPEIDFDGDFGNTPEEAEILNRYADVVHNYYYEYKPQSGENPDVTHTGSMAQEIERVDPALIKVGPRGKMVDTPRLTLTNTGAIGTLARKTEGLEQQVASLQMQVEELLRRT